MGLSERIEILGGGLCLFGRSAATTIELNNPSDSTLFKRPRDTSLFDLPSGDNPAWPRTLPQE